MMERAFYAGRGIAMQLKLKNIGKISYANINLNGITVIAGENNTGKSTVGKVLHSVFNGFYNFDDKIKNARISLFSSVIKKEFDIRYEKFFIDSKQVAISLFDNSTSVYDEVELEKLIDSNVEFFSFGDNDINENFEVTSDFLKFVLDNFYKYKEISDEQIFINIFNNRIKNVFKSQINNFNTADKGVIELKIRDKTLEFILNNNEVSSISNMLSLKTQAIYLDNPFILDEWALYYYNNARIRVKGLQYRRELVRKLLSTTGKTEVEEAIAKEVMREKINNVLNKINVVCDGSLSFDFNEGFSYTGSGSVSLDINNISAGLKTFILIKELLTNGSLEENGTIILDEPEIHLHPEWQLLFAEIIVLLQKEFNLHILLTTHSPYFIRAIQVYASKYKISDLCNYYLSELNKEGSANILDVADNIDRIYSKLSTPLQKLEDERWEDD